LLEAKVNVIELALGNNGHKNDARDLLHDPEPAPVADLAAFAQPLAHQQAQEDDK